MIAFFVWLIVVLLLAWLAFYVLQRINLPEPARTVVIVGVALVLLVFLLRLIGVWGGGPVVFW